MPLTELETRLIILEERSENARLQIARFVSHLESEQRVTGNISKRVDMCEKMIGNAEHQIEMMDKILLNGNGGLVVRIDRLEQRNDGNKNRLVLIISIASTLISLITLILHTTR